MMDVIAEKVLLGQLACERLKGLQELGDSEIIHLEADAILCHLLEKLGYANVVKEWQKVEKWYA